MQISETLISSIVGLISAIHFGIAFAEIFLWKLIYPRLKQFGFTPSEAEKAGPIVANAGLYNGFLASGLLWSALVGSDFPALRLFLLACVIAAGLFGAVTLKAPKTLALQTFPALFAAWLVYIARP
jgi:putative membrane protein